MTTVTMLKTSSPSNCIDLGDLKAKTAKKDTLECFGNKDVPSSFVNSEKEWKRKSGID